ncbi:hypothetical protein HD596_005825 [Nonomuraea jabiensis]|uniref:Uncharacterized protein n=1 Tax=Nonomuraea jabiensis TaxID=882448 RepID=A0A7W9LCT7_9ACTN|nr:hypothetical protein [Nonomuraea jabiensis]
MTTTSLPGSRLSRAISSMALPLTSVELRHSSAGSVAE